jgi:hypothetical protein
MMHGVGVRQGPTSTRVSVRARKQHLSRRQARWVGLGGFAIALLFPAVIWHRPIAIIASDFRMDLEYLLTGWTGYSMIALGLLFMVPVILSIGRTPASRLYPRSRNAYAAWGICLYLLGLALASQVAAVTGVQGSP